MKSNSLKRNLPTENDLIGIFQQQYDDIFCQILTIDQFNFFNTLKKQVIAYLEIQNKQISQTLMKKSEEIFVKKYLKEKDIITKDFKAIKELPNEQLDYLNRLNCIIHCPKCKDALHTCGLKFILYGDYVYCLSCMKVYNENQVNMYCEECDIEYYTQLREIKDCNLESYFQVSISNYHCRLDYEEKIICPKCEKGLYADINSLNNFDKIEEIICINCNLIFDASLFKYKCKKCGTHFKSDAKIYNSFYNKKNDLICKVHALSNKILASPLCTINKGFECNLNYIMKYKHFDGGVLFLGERNGKKIILCDKCYEIFDYYNFIFSCPLCNKKFNPSYANTSQKINKGNESSNFPSMKSDKCKYDREINKKQSLNLQNKNKTLQILIKENNNLNKSNSNYNSIQIAERCDKCKCSLIDKTNLKRKNIINPNPFSTRTKKLLKNNNNKTYLKDISKASKEKEIFKGIMYTQPSKMNSNQKINIRIQNFYNNYVPIIHIVENRRKSKDIPNNSKYNLKRNYTIIKASPRGNETSRTIIDKQNNSSNALKSRIEEMPKYYLDLGGLNKRKNLMNIKEYNYNDCNSKLETKQKYNSFFNDASTSQRSSKNLNYCFNKKFCTDPLNKDRKLVYSTEKDKNRSKLDNKNTNNKNNKKNLGELYITDINKKNINLTQNSIKVKENDLSRKIKTIKPNKILKLENKINFTAHKSISNKQVNKLINILSLSEEKGKIEMENNRKNISDSKKTNDNKNMKNNLINNITTNENNLNSSINTTINSKPKVIVPTNIKKLKMTHKYEKIEEPKLNLMKGFDSEHYNILSVLGEGTFSQIFLVENNITHEKFALKKMTATKLGKLEEKKHEFELIMKLTKEEQKLNLVKVYGIQIKKLDKFNMVLYILMEPAKSDWENELKKRHYEKKFYTEEELKIIILSLVRTFSSLQKRGICHRDVKPQNILSFGNGVYKVTDFGEAKANRKSYKSNFTKNTSVQTVRGTELYMSPILFNALRQNPENDLQYNAFKSDVFSLGLCILLACTLSYQPLYQMRNANNMANIKAIIGKYINNRYSKNISDLLFKMLQLEEKDRPDFIELESIITNNF